MRDESLNIKCLLKILRLCHLRMYLRLCTYVNASYQNFNASFQYPQQVMLQIMINIQSACQYTIYALFISRLEYIALLNARCIQSQQSRLTQFSMCIAQICPVEKLQCLSRQSVFYEKFLLARA